MTVTHVIMSRSYVLHELPEAAPTCLCLPGPNCLATLNLATFCHSQPHACAWHLRSPLLHYIVRSGLDGVLYHQQQGTSGMWPPHYLDPCTLLYSATMVTLCCTITATVLPLAIATVLKHVLPLLHCHVCRVFDTPGVPHPYQLTSRLNLRELAAVLPRRRLKPRTYCVPVGNSILIGALQQ